MNATAVCRFFTEGGQDVRSCPPYFYFCSVNFYFCSVNFYFCSVKTAISACCCFGESLRNCSMICFSCKVKVQTWSALFSKKGGRLDPQNVIERDLIELRKCNQIFIFWAWNIVFPIADVRLVDTEFFSHLLLRKTTLFAGFAKKFPKFHISILKNMCVTHWQICAMHI